MDRRLHGDDAVVMREDAAKDYAEMSPQKGVIPAKAGIHVFQIWEPWIPVCTGMTRW